MYHVGPHLIEHAGSHYRPLLCVCGCFTETACFVCCPHKHKPTVYFHNTAAGSGQKNSGSEEGSSLISADKKPGSYERRVFYPLCIINQCAASEPAAPSSPPPEPLGGPPKPAASASIEKKSCCGEWKVGCGVINYITAEPFLSGRVATVFNNAMVKGAREHRKEDLT